MQAKDARACRRVEGTSRIQIEEQDEGEEEEEEDEGRGEKRGPGLLMYLQPLLLQSQC